MTSVRKLTFPVAFLAIATVATASLAAAVWDRTADGSISKR
jgi:hypothetical protein